jgi:hypothetical protein
LARGIYREDGKNILFSWKKNPLEAEANIIGEHMHRCKSEQLVKFRCMVSRIVAEFIRAVNAGLEPGAAAVSLKPSTEVPPHSLLLAEAA